MSERTLNLIHSHYIRWMDLRLTDMKWKEQHVSIAGGAVDEDLFTDGKMFDSSVARGEPIKFPLNKVIQGWREGVMLMVEGETRRLWIPQDLAYKGAEGPPKGMLVFDVQLLEIEPPGTPIE